MSMFAPLYLKMFQNLMCFVATCLSFWNQTKTSSSFAGCCQNGVFAHFCQRQKCHQKKTSSFCHADVQNQNITSIEFLTFFANHLFQICKSLQEQMFKNCANLPSTYIFFKKKVAKLFNSMPEEGRRIFCWRCLIATWWHLWWQCKEHDL